MRSPRSVTLQPMAWPSRRWKPAMDFLARVTQGCWPVMVRRSAMAASSSFESEAAAPTPMFTTIFSRRGTSLMFLMPSSCSSLGTISVLYCSFRRGAVISFLFR